MNRFQIYDFASRMSGDRDLATLQALKMVGFQSASDAILALPRGPSLDTPIPSAPGIINAAERAIQDYASRVFKDDLNSEQALDWHTRHLAGVADTFEILHTLAIRGSMPTDEEIGRLREVIDTVTHVTSSEATKYILPLFERRAVRDGLEFLPGRSDCSDDEIGGMMAAKALGEMKFYLKIRVPDRNGFVQISEDRGVIDMSNIIIDIKGMRSWGAFADISEDYIYGHAGPNAAEFLRELHIFSEQGDFERLQAAHKKAIFSPIYEMTEDWHARNTEHEFESMMINSKMSITERMAIAKTYYESIVHEVDRFIQQQNEVRQDGPGF